MSVKRRGKGRTLTAGAVALLVGLALLVYFKDELKAWYVVWTQFERIETNPQGYAEYLHRRTDIVFVRLPGGPCTLGVSQEDIAEWLSRQGSKHESLNNQMAQHMATAWTPRTVRVSSCLMAKEEISAAQWQSVMSDSSSAPSPNHLLKTESWDSFREFCEPSGSMRSESC